MAFNTKTFDGHIASGGGGGGVSGLTEDQILFGKADGTIEQNAGLSWDDSSLKVAVSRGSYIDMFILSDHTQAPVIGGYSFGSNLIVGSNVGTGATSLYGNVILGLDSALNLNYGLGNSVVVGSGSASDISNGNGITAIGSNAFTGNSGTEGGFSNVAIGSGAFQDIHRDVANSIAIGPTAGRGFGAYAGAGGSIQNMIFIGRDAGEYSGGANNVFIGESAGVFVQGYQNIGIGGNALRSNFSNQASGGYNVALGGGTLRGLTTGYENIAVGRFAGSDITEGHKNVFIGSYSGVQVTTGSFNIGIGDNVMNRSAASVTGDNNVAVGRQAMGYLPNVLSGSNNNAVGRYTLYDVTSGTNNNAFGVSALQNVLNGNENIGIGYQAGVGITSGGNNIAIGHETFRDVNPSWGIAIGDGAGIDASGVNNVIIGRNAFSFTNTAAPNLVMIGYGAGAFSTSWSVGGKTIAIGGRSLFSSSGGGNTIAIGYQAGQDSAQDEGIFIGYRAGKNMNADTNIAIGFEAGYHSGDTIDGTDHIFIGRYAGRSHTTAVRNMAIGPEAMGGTGDISGGYNMAIGASCMDTGSSTITGQFNCLVGQFIAAGGSGTFSGSNNAIFGRAAANSLRSGSQNTVIGNQAMQDQGGFSGCIAIGYRAGKSNGTSNRLFIDNADNGADSLIYGEMDNDVITIGGRFGFRDGFVSPPTTFGAGNNNIALTDHVVLKTAITAAGDTMTLPSGAATGQQFYIVDASGNAGTDNITLDTAGAELINGAATLVIATNRESVQLIFDGTNYFRI